MKNRHLAAIAALLALAGAALLMVVRSRPDGPTMIALTDLYSTADKRTNAPATEAFSLTQVTIAGMLRQSIFMHPTSRLTYKQLKIPVNAGLRVWVAVQPAAWDRPESDGVLFRFGVSDGPAYVELANRHVDPHNELDDRRWIPIVVDLSAYGGRQVDLVFNTNSSLPGRGDNAAFDWAVWGTPEIFVRQR